MRLKSILKTTHTWSGLIFGAVLCLTCLSGILWALAGAAPLALFVTGLLVWFRKKPARNAGKQADRDEFLVTR